MKQSTLFKIEYGNKNSTVFSGEIPEYMLPDLVKVKNRMFKKKLDNFFEIYKDKEQITYDDIKKICEELYKPQDEFYFERISREVEGLLYRLGYPDIHISYDIDNYKLNVEGNLYKARDVDIELYLEEEEEMEFIPDTFINDLERCAEGLVKAAREFMEYKSSNDQYAPLVLDIEKCSVILEQIVAFYKPDKCDPSIFSIKSKDDIFPALTDITIAIESVKNMFLYMNHHNDEDKMRFVSNLKSASCKLRDLIVKYR